MNIPLAPRHKSPRPSRRRVVHRASGSSTIAPTPGRAEAHTCRLPPRHARSAMSARSLCSGGAPGVRTHFIRQQHRKIVERLGVIHKCGLIDVSRDRLVVPEGQPRRDVQCILQGSRDADTLEVALAPTGHPMGIACDSMRPLCPPLGALQIMQNGSRLHAPGSERRGTRRRPASPRSRCSRRRRMRMAPVWRGRRCRGSLWRNLGPRLRHARILIGPGVPPPHSAAST